MVFWWQRRTRGWDDSETWNLDRSLAELILPRLKRFVELPSGHPCDLTAEEWETALAAMVASFESIVRDDYYIRTEQESIELQRGLEYALTRADALELADFLTKWATETRAADSPGLGKDDDA